MTSDSEDSRLAVGIQRTVLPRRGDLGGRESAVRQCRGAVPDRSDLAVQRWVWRARGSKHNVVVTRLNVSTYSPPVVAIWLAAIHTSSSDVVLTMTVPNGSNGQGCALGTT